MSHKHTHNDAASKASEVLRDANSSSEEKSAAGSTLSQKASGDRVTSESVASKASEVLRDANSSSEEKSAAGSALSQKEK